VGELLTLILEAPADYLLRLIPYTLVHRRAEQAVRVDVLWREQRYQALILSRSSDWYRFSLHLYAEREIELVIVGTHDSCLLLPVLSFDNLLPDSRHGVMSASAIPTLFAPRQTRWSIQDLSDAFRKTEYGHTMLIGGLMCKLPEAYQRLAQIPSRVTRLRITAEVQRLQHRRRGRPVKIRVEQGQQA